MVGMNTVGMLRETPRDFAPPLRLDATGALGVLPLLEGLSDAHDNTAARQEG